MFQNDYNNINVSLMMFHELEPIYEMRSFNQFQDSDSLVNDWSLCCLGSFLISILFRFIFICSNFINEWTQKKI